MPRESAREKGLRYLTEGRITVTYAGPDGIRATAKGQGYLYNCGWTRERGWWCECPAKTTCCHLHGLFAVTIAPAAAV